MKPIRLVVAKPEGRLSVCSSRFWGNPALPADCPFPVYTDEDGEEYPYTFICQINLSEIAPYDTGHRLPADGLLLFFAKTDCYLGYDRPVEIGGTVSLAKDVKVLCFRHCDSLIENILVDEDNCPVSPAELAITFAPAESAPVDDHAVFGRPTLRQWEDWEAPYRGWKILLQVDSFEGEDFVLNFMDCGVLDFIISPADLAHHDFSDVRAIVLSS